MALELERKLNKLDKEKLSEFINSFVYDQVPLSRVRTLREKISKVQNISFPLSRYNDSREESILRGLRYTCA